MTLHIRDLRQSDAAGLSRLCGTGHLLGALPEAASKAKILAGLRNDRLTGAVWIGLDSKTGTVPAIVVAQTAGWQSDFHELIAEAGLWLASRGAFSIDLPAIPADKDLLAGLLDMNFTADARAGTLRRSVPARSAA